MATSIFFNGRVIHVPGAYSENDASGLESVGLGASGIVAVLGTAEGGIPAASIASVDDIIRCNTPEKVRRYFRSGDLREVGDFLFAPSKDPDIPGGAQEVVAMKINPATQSSATFANAQGDALELTSVDYGAFTGQINVQILDTDPSGDARQVVVQFEDVTESTDSVGGDDIFTLSYRGPATGWETMTGAVDASGNITCAGTRADAGLDGAMGTQLAVPGAIQVVSGAADTGTVELWGLDSSSAAVKETLTLNGVTPVLGSQVFSLVLAARATGAAGTITVAPSGGGTTVVSIAPAATPGLALGQAMYVASLELTVAADGATTKKVLVEGKGLTGATQREVLTLAGATPVTGAAKWSEITALCLGDVEAARTLTFSATAAKSTGSVQTTVAKMRDYFNARQVVISTVTYGFICTLVTGQTAFAVTDLDVSVSPVSVLYPLATGFKADLWAMITWINNNSQYVTAAKASGATGGFPDNTSNAVFLSGGAEGAASSTDWQTGLNWLKRIRVNSVVVLTADPAVHAMVDAHCAYMCGYGRSERDGFVGILNAGLTGLATKTETKAQIVNLNSRHIRVCAQNVQRYNTAGELETFDPMFAAALAAGQQAGARVGTPLTSKFVNALGFNQHSSWNPTDDADEMVQAGLLFLDTVESVGRKWVRNVTTHLSSNNLAYIEGSVNQAANYAAYEFRTAMEAAVGKAGFAGTVNAANDLARAKLALLVDEGPLVTWRSLALELVSDVMDVSVEMAPVTPVNFVKITNHLVTIAQSA